MTKPTVTPFGALLTELLAARGMTRSQLARTLGMSPAFVTQMIHRQRGPSVRTLRRIADALDADEANRLRLFVAASEEQ